MPEGFRCRYHENITVKTVVPAAVLSKHGTGCGVPWVLTQSPPAFGRVADGAHVPGDEMVERRIEGNERPLVGGDSAQHILLVHATAKANLRIGS